MQGWRVHRRAFSLGLAWALGVAALGTPWSGAAFAADTTTPAPAQSTRGGVLRFLVEQEPTTLVTIAHTAGPSTRVSPKVTEGLLQYGFDYEPKPQLATQWSVSPDGLTYGFKLRPI